AGPLRLDHPAQSGRRRAVLHDGSGRGDPGLDRRHVLAERCAAVPHLRGRRDRLHRPHGVGRSAPEADGVGTAGRAGGLVRDRRRALALPGLHQPLPDAPALHRSPRLSAAQRWTLSAGRAPRARRLGIPPAPPGPPPAPQFSPASTSAMLPQAQSRDDNALSPPVEVLGISTRLGLTSFGGPIAHLGYYREEYVVRRRWLEEAQYADQVVLCQFLPGPASSQV